MSGFTDPEELVRALGEESVPPESPEVIQARRDRLVPILSCTVRESAVKREYRRRHRRWAALALAAVVVLAVGFGFRAFQPEPRRAVAQSAGVAVVGDVSGTLVVTHQGRPRIVGESEHPDLMAGDEVRTAADGGAVLKTERSAIRVAAATQLSVLAPSSAEERIRLGIGHVELTVAKQPKSPRSVVVETPHADVVVRGTVFSVEVGSEAGKSVTRVNVREGSVWVVHGGGRDLVASGEEWASNGPPARPPAPSEPSKSLAPEAPPAPGKSGARLAKEEAPAPAARSGTLAEENRMFQAAIDARNRGESRKAVELFGGLLARYPKSRLAEEARVERMRALKAAGDSKRAAAEARRYLADHAGGFARDEARDTALTEK